MRLSIQLAGVALFASAALTAPAQAQLTSAGLSCNNGNATSLMGAIACAGSFTGNNKNQQSDVLAQMASSFNGTTGNGSWWSYVGDPSFSGNSTGNVNFTSPITGYFAIVLKTSNQFSIYLFDGGTTGSTGFNFTDIGTSVNNNNVIQNLSHASLYAVSGDSYSVTSTPEPASLVLVGSGLLGIAAWRRRRRA